MKLDTGIRASKLLKVCAVSALATGICGAAQADSGRKHLALVGIPSATVAPGGLGFVGLSYSTKRTTTDHSADGSAILGFGLGDANDGVGFQFGAHIVSLTDDFADTGYFSVKASTRIADGASPTYASLTVSHLGAWGTNVNEDPSTVLALTRFSGWKLGKAQDIYPVMMTIGAGSNVSDFGQEAGIFGGFGIGLNEYMSASVAWAGDELSVGSSFKIKGLDDLFVSVSLDDALNDRDFQRVTLSVGYQFPNLFGG